LKKFRQGLQNSTHFIFPYGEFCLTDYEHTRAWEIFKGEVHVTSLKDIKMRPKLIALFLMIGIIPLVVGTAISVYRAANALEHEAFAELEAVQTIKAHQIQGYFEDCMGDVEVYAFNSAVQTAMTRFETGFKEAGGPHGTTWNNWNNTHGPKLKLYKDIYGYDDIYMISVEGNVVWSAAGHSDLGTNLNSGSLKNTGLAKAYSQGLNGKAFIDFEYYEPTGHPEAFVATAMRDLSGELVGVLAYQIALDHVNEVMHERVGMGETGETYLVGSDLKMRSDSDSDPESHSVEASFSGNVKNNGVDTEATKEAFAGNSGHKIIKNHTGHSVYSVYSKIELPSGVEWAVIAEKDVKEVQIPVASIRNASILIGLIMALIIAVVAYFIAQSIAKPIEKIKEYAKAISIGDHSPDININRKDEIGELGTVFRELLAGLRVKEETALSIAEGDLSVDIEMLCADDTLNEALIKVRDRLSNLVSETDKIVQASIVGELTVRADATGFSGEYKNVINGLNDTMETLVGHLDSIPTPFMIIDRDFSILFMNKAGAGIGSTNNEQLHGTKCFDYFKTSDCHTKNCACANAMNNNRKSDSETDAHPLPGLDLEIAYSGTPLHNQQGDVIGAFEFVMDQTAIKGAQKKSEKISKYQAHEVEKLSSVLEKMARGDLTVNYKMADADEDTAQTKESFEGISSAFEKTLAGLNEILGQVNVAVEQVSSGSNEVSSSSQSLSEGATQQAASLEEISATMVQVGAQTKQNAENSSQANQLVSTTGVSAESGSNRMKDMLNAMDEINSSSGQIQKIIKVIDEIAFQTNLLALNAAVEAARAGVHGKGFAVVAEEVRNLAKRSAQAASETTELIEGSVSKAQNGSSIAQETSKALEEIVNQVSKVSDLISEINAGSTEQNVAIGEVTESLGQIDQVTQGNTANAEESASAAEELSGQATQLQEMLSRFRLTSRSSSSFNYSGSNGGQKKLPGGNGVGAKRQATKPENDLYESVNPATIINLDDDDFGSF
jgi:methyl-accepting chemotaxis protein